jgi:hypothetical protein
MKKKINVRTVSVLQLKIFENRNMQLWKKVNNRPTPNTGIYLPHTSKRSALDPKPGPGWCDFIFERFDTSTSWYVQKSYLPNNATYNPNFLDSWVQFQHLN